MTSFLSVSRVTQKRAGHDVFDEARKDKSGEGGAGEKGAFPVIGDQWGGRPTTRTQGCESKIIQLARPWRRCIEPVLSRDARCDAI